MKIDLLVENTNDKYANKFNAGSVLSGGKWYSVRKPVKLTDFKDGELTTVELTETTGKDGRVFQNITKVYSTEADLNVQGASTTKTEAITTSAPIKVEYKQRDFDKEARGKVAFGAFGDALKSPGLVLDAPDLATYLERVKAVAEEHIKFTWEHSK